MAFSFRASCSGILTLLVVFALTTGALRTSLCVSIGLAALFYLVIPPPITNWFLYQGTPSPPAMLVNWLNVLKLGLHSWFHPAAPFSAFSTFPRSLCAVLSFAAFAIRWSGRPVAAYWVPLLIGGVHQSTSLILLFALIGCDIVVRPADAARAPAIVLAIVVNLALIVLRERMFAILGFSSSDVVIATAILLCVVVALAMLRPVRVAVRAGWEFVAAWRDRTVAAVPLPFADALTIFAAWLAVILISYLASRNDAWYRLIYFWSELSPRYIGMFQLILHRRHPVSRWSSRCSRRGRCWKRGLRPPLPSSCWRLAISQLAVTWTGLARSACEGPPDLRQGHQ